MTSEIKELTEELTELKIQLNSNPALSDALKTVSQINGSLPEEENAALKPASENIDSKLIELKRKIKEVNKKQEELTSEIQEMRIMLEKLEEKEFEKKEEKLKETDLLEMVKSLELCEEEASLRARIVDRLHSWSNGFEYAKFTEFLSYLDPNLKERIGSNLKNEEKPTKLQDPGKSKTKKIVSESNLAKEDKKIGINEFTSVSEVTVCEDSNCTNEKACEKTMQTSMKDDKNKAKDSEEGRPDKAYPAETNCESRATFVEQKILKPDDKKPNRGEDKTDDNEEAMRYVALETALRFRKKAVPCTKRLSSEHWLKQFFIKVVNETNETVLEMMEALKLEEEAIDLRSSIVSRIMLWGSGANHSILIDILLRKIPETKDCVTFNEVTPLMLAATANHTKAAKVLIERGVDINKTCCLGGSALTYAANIGNVSVVKMLLKAGININTQDVMGKSPLHFAADGNDYGRPKHHKLEILKLLLKAGANMELKDAHGATPLILAVFTDFAEAVRILLRAGANKNAQDHLGHTALHFAVRDGQTNIFKMLLRARVDLEVKDTAGLTALHAAAIKERAEFIMELLEVGANPKAKSKGGHTPAHYARKWSIKTLFHSKL